MNALYDFAQQGSLPPFDKLDAAQVQPALARILEDLAAAQRALEPKVAPTWDSAV
ncbi:MAG: hypothetical protein IT382_18825, partial [Deltaproteobacteria bacterium]|nr:hypothetical protein [Deltaproteobacteria bacterium]